MRAAKTLVICLFVLVSLTAAHADEFVFNTTAGGTWSYGGPGGTFSGTAVDLTNSTININGGPAIAIGDLTVSVTTGVTTFASGSLALFSSTGSSFSISNIGFGTIFSGSLADASLNLLAGGATGPIFSATFIVGTFNPDFIAWGGFPALLQGAGKTTFNLLGNFSADAQGGGAINGSVSDLTQVPEPASLALLGSGLLATGGFVRRKLIA